MFGMRRTGLLFVTAALAVLLLSGVWGSAAREARGATNKPNIVFILADDMRKGDLKYMPKTRSVLKDKGMSFRDAYVSNPLCCPSRATTMRGQYAHNTGVWNMGGSSGGWATYRNNDLEKDNVATRLDAAGYSTALIGKYLNGYSGTTNKPPGWDRWFVHTGSTRYYNYKINDDGSMRRFGSSTAAYETDVIANRAKTFIGTSATAGKPFFAYVAPKAPHSPNIPAPRDNKHTFDNVKAPRPPSFNEQNVSDKPPWIRQLPRLSDAKRAKIDNRAEKRAETLQALDDLVAGIGGKLKDKGVLSNTYIFFTSDNGFHMGEHRIPGRKGRPYEEDVHVPLLVRGPGVAAGHQAQKLALNTDFLPTFTDLAGAHIPGYVDGRSLLPVLEGNATAWRSAVLLEARRTGGSTPPYSGIRTSSGRKYVKYADGKKELYYLGHDPYELRDSYNPKSPPAIATRLAALATCAEDRCRAAENRR
jgi:N-acetylglucosamine-6-sulfatase